MCEILSHIEFFMPPGAILYFVYKAKIINPKRKSNVMVHQLHSIHLKFATVNGLQVKLIEELEEQVLHSLKFGLVYFDGRHQKALVSAEDLKVMYSKRFCGVKVGAKTKNVSWVAR